MINSIVKKVTGKEIILFNRHRNSITLLNKQNRQCFIFMSPWWLIKGSAIFGRRSRLRYRMFAAMLNLINPRAIIDINWTARHCSLYNTWCRKNGRRFIVVQHGAYIAGVLCDIKEKYVNCTTFLVWGEHFKRLVERNNPGKQFECIVFGNPAYNDLDREKFIYKKNQGNSVLVAVSVISGDRLEALVQFLRQLEAVGFEVTVKEHNKQREKSKPIEGFEKSTISLYDLLKNQSFDFVLTDVSSAMLDTIVYKNRAIFFSPPGEDPVYTDNVYSQFLPNLAERQDEIKSVKDLFKFIDIAQQENLLQHMAAVSGTNNRLDNLDEKIRQQQDQLQEAEKETLQNEWI